MAEWREDWDSLVVDREVERERWLKRLVEESG